MVVLIRPGAFDVEILQQLQNQEALELDRVDPELNRPRTDFPLVWRLSSDFRKTVKKGLTYFPSWHGIKLLTHLGDLRRWKERHLTPATPTFPDRPEMYRYLIDKVLPDEFVFLEFGCAAGRNVEWWAEAVPNPAVRFVGFDTFVGMPEAWKGLGWSMPEGAWSQLGQLPETSDDRVSYVKGKFQDSLKPYMAESGLLEAFDHYVIHIDADLYTAALYVLVTMRPVLHKATVLFDEFDSVLDELRALEDFCNTFGMRYTVLTTAKECEKIAIRFEID